MNAQLQVNHELPEYEQSAVQLLAWTASTFGSDVILTSSFGADSAVMLHLASRVIPNLRVVFLDTGYLFPETYRFVETLRQRLDLNIHSFSPTLTAAALEAIHGKLWEGSPTDLERYLKIVKVEPMQRALRELKPRAWLAGLRADQTEHRAQLQVIEYQDVDYEVPATPLSNAAALNASGVRGVAPAHAGQLAKISPILNWTRQDIEDYLTRYGLPSHPLVAEGYRSIGDVHSTAPASADDPRGRRLGEKRECGLHLMRGAQAPV